MKGPKKQKHQVSFPLPTYLRIPKQEAGVGKDYEEETGGIEAEAEACPNEIELLEGERKLKTEHTTDGDFRNNQKSFRRLGRQG